MILKIHGADSSEVSFWFLWVISFDLVIPWPNIDFCIQTFKHIFTSPSSVEKEPKATRSGNARIHGMTHVAPASIAYVATQVRTIIFWFSMNQSLTPVMQARFALTSSPTFTRSDSVTDSERFYNSILELFEDPDEQEEVNDLLVWWNR
jgi:hypothetical protein